MKKIYKLLTVMCVIGITICASGCREVDKNYGVKAKDTSSVSSNNKDGIKIPEIKSDDAIMPTYFDISLYDEENYADIYLGKKFNIKMTYCGNEFEVPTDYKTMTQNGWKIVDENAFNDNSPIMAGKSVNVNFINEYEKQITAVFYNKGKSSVKLKKCPIVKFIIPENVLNSPESVYGQFWVNGISNESAITDIVDYLGAPSHFYAKSDTEYYLDYFITQKDKRNGITVYIDTADDSVHAIEVANYD